MIDQTHTMETFFFCGHEELTTQKYTQNDCFYFKNKIVTAFEVN